MPPLTRSFSRPLPNGAGSLTVSTERNAWSLDRPFPRDVETLAEVRFELDTGMAFALGSGEDLLFTVSSSGQHELELVWPEDDRGREALAPFDIVIAPTELGIRLRLEGSASASAAMKVPAGPLRVGPGVAAGGSYVYERFVTVPADRPVPLVLADVFDGLRLPTEVRSADTLPAAKEVLSSQFTGYLQLTADLAWGATLTNSRGIAAGDVAMDFESRLAFAATATAKYRLAGMFDIHCCRAADRARFVVRKARESEFAFAADFKLDAAFTTAGFPRSANEFLGRLLGADADRVLRTLDQVRQLDSLEKARSAVGELAAASLHKLAEPLIDKALDDASVGAFLAALRQVSAQYTSLDSQVARLFQTSLAEIPEVTDALRRVTALGEPDALKRISDARLWTIFRRLAGDRLYDALLDQEEFRRVLALAASALDFFENGPDRLKRVVQALQNELALDPLIRALERLASPEELRTLADVQLQTLAALLVGKPFDALAGAAGPAFRELRAALQALDRFNERWYERLVETANSTFSFDTQYAFAHASASEALLDVEIDVGTSEGQRLARRAAIGDFSEVLSAYRSPAVRIREAVLTHRTMRERDVRTSVLGFELRSLSRLLTSAEAAFERLPSGLLLVYTTESELRRERRRGNEETLTSFLVRAVAQSESPGDDPAKKYFVDTLRSLAASYRLKHLDAETSREELLEYLALAEFLGLLRDRAAFVASLDRELPQGWQHVAVEYIVRYDDAALASVFRRDTSELLAIASRSMRMLVGDALISRGLLAAARGLAYQSDFARQQFSEASNRPPSFESRTLTVVVPRWVTRDRPRTIKLSREEKKLLERLFRMEANYLRALTRLDATIDRLRSGGRVTGRELTDVATDFVAFADDMPSDSRINPFFGIVDALVAATAPRGRRSVMMLEIVPSGGTQADALTKMLSSV